jgi:hypothetical protein
LLLIASIKNIVKLGLKDIDDIIAKYLSIGNIRKKKEYGI